MFHSKIFSSKKEASDAGEKTLREIVDAYSPIVRGKKGLLGLALKTFALPLETAQNVAHAARSFPFHFGYENTAGQVVTDCDGAVPKTFRRMEKRLQDSFNSASAARATPIDRESFLALAAQVTADGQALAKHCTILRTEFDTVTEPYKFIVRAEPLKDGSLKLTSLEQGLAGIRRALNGEAPANENAKNPVVVRRKPISLPPPGTPGVAF